MILLVLFAFGWAERESFRSTSGPVHSGDDNVWAEAAREPLLSISFWSAVRPFTVPLVYKLAHDDEAAIVRLQSIASVLCWFSLALAVACSFDRGFVRVAAAATIGALSLTIPINQWDYVVGSESLCCSFLALVCAHSLIGAKQLLRGRTLGWLFLFLWVLTAFVFAGTRDTVAYSLLCVGLAAAIWFARTIRLWWSSKQSIHAKVARDLAIVAMACCAIGLFSRWSNVAGERWRTPLINVLLQRIIPEPDAYAQWQRSYGLPDNAMFTSQAGHFAWDSTSDGSSLRDDIATRDQFTDVRQWLAHAGVSSYQRWLLVDRPFSAIAAVGANFAQGINSQNRGYGHGSGVMWFTRALTVLLYHSIPFPLLVWFAALSTSVYLSISSRPYRIPSILASLLLVNCWIQAFVGFHGDAAEPPRHTMLAGVLLRLGLIVLGLIGLSLVADVVEARRPASDGDAVSSPSLRDA